jgi:hypothetical protein
VLHLVGLLCAALPLVGLGAAGDVEPRPGGIHRRCGACLTVAAHEERCNLVIPSSPDWCGGTGRIPIRISRASLLVLVGKDLTGLDCSLSSEVGPGGHHGTGLPPLQGLCGAAPTPRKLVTGLDEGSGGEAAGLRGDEAAAHSAPDCTRLRRTSAATCRVTSVCGARRFAASHRCRSNCCARSNSELSFLTSSFWANTSRSARRLAATSDTTLSGPLLRASSSCSGRRLAAAGEGGGLVRCFSSTSLRAASRSTRRLARASETTL